MLIGLENRAENVALVRQALTGLGKAVRLPDALMSDVKTAVSEACNNVVVHAYSGERGPMDVYATPEGRELSVVVRDAGEGIQPRPSEPEGGMQGVGLSLIQALTERVEFEGGAGEGTEVRMTFVAPGEIDLGVDSISGNGEQPALPPDGDIRLSVCGMLTGPVISSVVTMVAARSGFSVERLSDAQILADAIAAHSAGSFVGRHVHLALDNGDRQLAIKLGPLVADGGQALIRASAVGGLEPLLERLADEVSVRDGDSGEELLLRLRERAT